MGDETKKRFCKRCPQGGRLLPQRKGKMVCVECGGTTPDVWGATEYLGQGDYNSFAQYTLQLRETRRAQRECKHERVMVALRPWCSECGLVLPKDHPLVMAALAKVEAMRQSNDGIFGAAVRKAAGRG